MTQEKKKSVWGVGIAMLYGSFALFMVTIVIYVSFEDFHLVDRNYYEQGVNYQQQLDKTNRATALSQKPTFSINREDQLIMLTFPKETVADNLSGTITLYNPTDAEKDISLPISINQDNVQWIPYSSLSTGNWKLKIDWSVDTKTYFIEESIYLDSKGK